MKSFFLFLKTCFSLCGLIACASAPPPAPTSIVITPQMSVAQLDATFCHMQLTDLQSSFKTKKVEATEPSARFYSLRMELRQKINEWVQKDPQLSIECQKLAYDVQNDWRKSEEQILARDQRDGPSDQRVFTNSQRQLTSNPYLLDAQNVTSVSELQNGDVILADDKLSVISKNEQGEMHSWFPDTPGRWVRLSMHHSLGWLKQPAKRVVVLRHWSPNKAEQMVRWVQAQQKNNRFKQREPSSAWTELASFLQTSPELPLEANPNFLQVFEWRNHSALGNTSP